MKKIRKVVILFICVFSLIPQVYANQDFEDEEIEVLLDSDHNEEPIIDRPSKRKLPSRPIRCIINFSTNEVSISPAFDSEILFYEIWDEDNNICMVSVSDSNAFCEQLRLFKNQLAIIKFVTETSTYKGYFYK